MFSDGCHIITYPNKDIKQFYSNGNIVSFHTSTKSFSFEFPKDNCKIVKYKDRIEQIFYLSQIKLV